MPAKITVQSGISAGTTHWIERPVIRIGSDPQSDVCLPSADVAAHALTLEYRDGQYRVYNRCRSNVFVGMRSVETGKAVTWADTDLLQLNDDIELVLDVEEDPTPRPMRPDDVYENEEEDNFPGEVTDRSTLSQVAIKSDSAKEDSSKFLIQLAVTILCFAGCAGLLAREALKAEDAGGFVKPPIFTEVVRDANSSNTSPELVQRLQFAESAAIRGNEKSARERYSSLRDDLLQLRNTFLSESRNPELAILDFVEYRLGQLEQ